MADLLSLDRDAETDGAVVTIRLNRPPVNALNLELQTQLRAAADTLGADDTVRAVVLYGGEKLFVAGADVKEMAAMDGPTMRAKADELSACVSAIAQLPVPVVAAVTGFALGGGCELALAADRRISADDAKWGQPEILLGIIPGMGGSQRLARLVGPSRAKDLIFSGRFVGAAEAVEIGLADEVHPAAEVYPAALAWARQFAGGPRLALAAAKQSIDHGLDGSLADGLALESRLFAGLFDTADRTAGMDSFVANGPGRATFTGR